MYIDNSNCNCLANTSWTRRPNKFKNFASLILTNSITGAASMFPADLLSYLLPFPEKIGNSYHDHWLGCLALAMGNVGYIDRPLYDYVQHSNNVLGYQSPQRDGFLSRITRFLKN